MDKLQEKIIYNYKYIINRLEHGYKEDLNLIMSQIIAEKFKCKIDNYASNLEQLLK